MAERTLEIKIEEAAEKPPKDSRGREVWQVQLTVNGCAYAKVTVRYPFSDEEEEECSKCLNDGLMDIEFKPYDASGLAGKVENYRKDLIKDLKLDLLTRDEGCKDARVVFDINERSNEALQESKSLLGGSSIHRIHWELLEKQTRWWFPHAKAVVVRRSISIHAESPSISRIQTAATHNGLGSVFRILLVVARHFGEQEDPSPSIIQCTLLRFQKQLLRQGKFHKIHLEVVRPGSFQELRNHLNRRTQRRIRPFFQVVHFDLHGGISPDTKTAYLAFNTYTESDGLITTQTPAKCIATELKRHLIPCAILNACETAVADAGIDANLSRVFIQNGISNVLAMSFRASDTMVAKFYEKFYRSFFLDMKEFCTAAGEARKVLELDPIRLNTHKTEYEMPDWFVPVTYTNGKELHAVSHHLVSDEVEILEESYDIQLFQVMLLSFADAMDGELRFFFYAACYILMEMLMRWMPIYLQSYHLDQEYPDLDPKSLDNNILRVEGAMLQPTRQVYFHSAQGVDDTALPLLDSLSQIWVRTHFVDRERLIVIRAESLLECWVMKKSRQLFWQLWKGRHCHDVDDPIVREENDSDEEDSSNTSTNATIIIVRNLHKLYPERCTRRHAAAQQKLCTWLRDRVGDQSTPDTGPYLVLVGKGEHTWLENIKGYEFLRARPTEYSQSQSEPE